MARSELSRGDEGTYVGAIGAGCVALWFFFIDLIQGHPLRTPSVLGQVLLFGQSRCLAPTHSRRSRWRFSCGGSIRSSGSCSARPRWAQRQSSER